METKYKVWYKDTNENEQSMFVWAKSITHAVNKLVIGFRDQDGRRVQVNRCDIVGIAENKDPEHEINDRVKKALSFRIHFQIKGEYIHTHDDRSYCHYIAIDEIDGSICHFVRRYAYGHISYILGLLEDEYTVEEAAKIFLTDEALEDAENQYDREVEEMESLFND